MPRGKAITPQQEEEMRLKYEGEGLALTDIAKEFGISKFYLSKMKVLRGWKKGKLVSGVQKSQADENMMKFIEKELLPDEVFGYIKDGMQNATEVVFEGKGENMLATPVPDYKTRLKYIQEYMKLTGHYPDPEEVKNILIQNNNNFSISSRDMDEVDPKKVTADYMELLG